MVIEAVVGVLRSKTYRVASLPPPPPASRVVTVSSCAGFLSLLECLAARELVVFAESLFEEAVAAACVAAGAAAGAAGEEVPPFFVESVVGTL